MGYALSIKGLSVNIKNRCKVMRKVRILGTSRIAAVAFVVISMALSGITNAALISPSSVIANTVGTQGSTWPEINLINQSGLAQGFTSGVTTLATYLGGDTTAASSSLGTAGWLGASTSGSISFDLGASHGLTDVLLWNDTDLQGIASFTMDVANNAAFTAAVTSSVFNPTVGDVDGGTDYGKQIPLQIFNLGGTLTGRYVRVNMTGGGGSFLNVGEFVFNTGGTAVPAPVPATLALLGLGLFGLGCAKRKKA